MAVGFGLLIKAFSDATGHDSYPKQCTSHSALVCELENLFFAVGRYPAAAIHGFLFASYVFNLSITTFKRANNPNA